jgi:eukaryotic-like serine/threonine-protein kinase
MTNPSPLESIFFAALAKHAPAERMAYLNEACVGNDELRGSIERMLAAQAAAGSFLERPVMAATSLYQTPITESPGSVIGPYKLLQQIGEGGMGVVFMAEQSEPIQRTVALKIIKPGMDTRQVIARFEAERQALAMMDHPNIAKVLDAGTTESGRPYFVMELVKGVPITKYCDEKHLPLRARLELMLPICQAVQHAHQKGLIHRDIKPSNVLVAEYDDHAVPKVIDFGVAKATAQKLTDRTMFTEFGQVIGTFEYMSPEQAKLNQLDIDTRSDIYSLGVLLYELLTGSTPFERKRLQEAAFDEMLRIIREEEPPKPSTRLSTADGLPSIAANRGLEPLKLNRLVRGELDWVVMKALEKDRNRRYETANGLAADLQRYLDDEPVAACPPSASYRFGKLARRHKTAIWTIGLVAVALCVGTVVSTWQAIRATRSEHEQSRLLAVAEEARASEAASRKRAEADEQKALTAAAKSEQVAAFMKQMLGGVAPSVALGRDTKMLHEILDATATRFGKELTDQPAVEADLRSTLGTVYFDLGDRTRAEAMHRRALDLRKELYGNEHPDIADSLHNLGDVLAGNGNYSEAEALHREALAMRQKLFGAEHPQVAKSLLNVAEVVWRQGGRSAEAESLDREALAMAKKLLGNDDVIVASALHGLSNIAHHERKYADAEAPLREVLAIERKQLGDPNPTVAGTLLDLGWALELQNKFAEAEPLLRESIAMRKKIYGGPDAVSLYVLGSTLLGENKLAEAETADREAVATWPRNKAFNHFRPELSYNLAMILRHEGKLADAEAAARDAMKWEVELYNDKNLFYLKQSLELNNVLQDEGKLAEAETSARQMIDSCSSVNSLHRYSPNAYINLATVLQLQGRLPEAETAARQAIKLQGEIYGDEGHFQAKFLMRLASVLVDLGKTAEAENTNHEALVMVEKLFGPDDLDIAKAHLIFADILLKKRQREEAEKLHRDVLAIQTERLFKAHLGFDDEYADITRTLERITSLLQEDGRLAEAEALQREVLDKVRATVGTDQPLVAGVLGQLSATLVDEEKFSDAEPMARECFQLEEKFSPDSWQPRCAQCVLGVSLLGQQKYADAEPLLVAGYEGLKQREATIPKVGKARLKEAAQGLVKLYEATDQAGKAALWNEKLAEFDKLKTEQ